MNNEEQLLKQYRETGELRVLGKLYTPYMPLLYGVCFRYLKDHERSEDAVIEIFEQLVDKLRIHTVTNFKSWLYTLARNYCLMELRKDGKMVSVSLDAESSDQLAGEAAAWGVESEFNFQHEQQLSVMESCMEQLPEGQHRCIKLFYLEQKCYQDIADLTGYEMNQVKSYIQNGKRNLKICMERNTDGK